ncbi:ferric reductase-like transmembrane domain-containing protein [Luedemannella flava]
MLDRALAVMSIGRLAGLAAIALLLTQVVLMARIPWLERAFGQDTFARWHRWVGFTSFHLLLVHILATWVGYSWEMRHHGYLDELWRIVWTLPGMLLAVAGTALITLVVGISLRAARRRLRYELWHLLHLYAYVGIGLLMPHILWNGTEFLGQTWGTRYLWAVYLLAAGSVLAFRVALPLLRSRRHRLTVTEVRPEGPGVVSVHMRGRDLDRLPLRAGHFLQWRFLGGRGWTRSHPYSLSAAPRPDALRITVKDVGDGLAHLRPGARVLFEGPYGRLTGAVRQRRKVALFAAGIGITPLRALLEELDYAPGEAVLVYRASTEADLVLRDELAALADERGVRIHLLVGGRGPAGDWRPAGADVTLTDLVPDPADHDFYVCGPPAWIRAVLVAARRAGVSRAQLHSERFSW